MFCLFCVGEVGYQDIFLLFFPPLLKQMGMVCTITDFDYFTENLGYLLIEEDVGSEV